tara:strand:+ start:210 stop:473 length:264 start_codon:yes stop_codon:yes gene_type:complete
MNFKAIPNPKTRIPVINAIKKTEFASENIMGTNCKKESPNNENTLLINRKGNEEIANKVPVIINNPEICETLKNKITIKTIEAINEK